MSFGSETRQRFRERKCGTEDRPPRCSTVVEATAGKPSFEDLRRLRSYRGAPEHQGGRDVSCPYKSTPRSTHLKIGHDRHRLEIRRQTRKTRFWITGGR